MSTEPEAFDDYMGRVDAPDLNLDNPEAREAWSIGGDREAGWALRMMARAEAETARVTAEKVARINDVKAWADAASSGPKRDADFFKAKLIEYRRRKEAEDPKLPKTFKLPDGSLVRRKGRDRVVVDDLPAVVEWARENCPDAVNFEVLTSVLAQKSKAVTDGMEGVLVTFEGVQVPGVRVVVGGDEYGVRPADTSGEPF